MKSCANTINLLRFFFSFSISKRSDYENFIMQSDNFTQRNILSLSFLYMYHVPFCKVASSLYVVLQNAHFVYVIVCSAYLLLMSNNGIMVAEILIVLYVYFSGYI